MYKIQLEDIIKKYPFMYEVNNKVYHIGAYVFKECKNPLALGYFQEYQDFIKSIDRNKLINHLFNENEMEYLVYLFGKIKAYSDDDSFKPLVNASNNEALTFINTLNEESKKELLFQLENYVYSFWYYNRKIK